MQYGLYRIEDDATTTLVSEHDDLLTGIAAGKYAVEVEDYDFAYALHSDSVRLATFAGGRIGYREWARRTGRLQDIHAVEDRYDKEIDELVGTKY